VSITSGNEAFSRVVIDAQFADQGWSTQAQNSVRYEYVLPDGTRTDYVLCDRHGRSAFKQLDLERRFATRQVRQDLFAAAIDGRIAGR